jgi:O-antigen biosynthesis protein WbqV
MRKSALRGTAWWSDVLGRSPNNFDPNQIRATLQGKSVLVTGAGGSIGSELCFQAAAMGADKVAMLDNHGGALFAIDTELAYRYPNTARRDILCDVRDQQLLDDWVDRVRPDVIFHAAAIKHVNLVERHPIMGVLTNLVGTRNVALAAKSIGARMVLISTDKAVGPFSFMGATKRLAEMLMASMQAMEPAGGAGRFLSVRFGNVFGSAGSVVPLFIDQIERGGPVTVTHAEAQRYFMTVDEAVKLVFIASAISAKRRSGLFVLEMGQPVKIIDLAQRMIDVADPDGTAGVKIEVTSLRDGEQVVEALVDQDEDVTPSGADGIVEVHDQGLRSPVTLSFVAELEKLALSGDTHSVVTLVRDALRPRERQRESVAAEG